MLFCTALSSGQIGRVPRWELSAHCRMVVYRAIGYLVLLWSAPSYKLSSAALQCTNIFHIGAHPFWPELVAVQSSTSYYVDWCTTALQSTETKKYWDTFYGPDDTYFLDFFLFSSNNFRVEFLILDHCEGLVVCNSIYWHADRRLLLGQCWGYAGSTQNAYYCHGRQYRLWHWFQSLPRKSNIFCHAFFQRFRVSHFLI